MFNNKLVVLSKEENLKFSKLIKKNTLKKLSAMNT